MAERLTRQSRCRRFGTGQGIGLIATALLTATLTLPMASAALASRTLADQAVAYQAGADQAVADQTQEDGNPVSAPVVRVEPAPVPLNSGPGLQTSLGRRQAAAVEKHIATLHRMLHVTPIQEPLWQPLARAMRDNVVELDGAYARRDRLHGTMSAMDDLKSYGMVQQIHARNVQSLIGPFQALYDSFSPSQKKEADDTVRSFTDNAVKNSR